MSFHLQRVLATAYEIKQIPLEDVPEIVVAGRSNVGKSSLINALFKGAKPARVGKHPGKTRSINFYLTREQFIIVDLPGYGYARGPRTDMERWKRLVEYYLSHRRVIVLFLLLVDIRRGIEQEEEMLVHTLKKMKIPYALVLTKIDKLNRNELNQLRTIITSKAADIPVLAFSARTGDGKKELIQLIERSLKVNA